MSDSRIQCLVRDHKRTTERDSQHGCRSDFLDLGIPVWVQFAAITGSHRRVAFVPFCKVTLTARKPKDYSTDPQTLGGHLKKRRRELGLYQKEVALRLGVNEWTYLTWENDKAEPVVSMFPRIIDFLGYYPYPAPQSLGERLIGIRRNLGASRARLAKMIEIDEGTLLRIERGGSLPGGISGARLRKFLATIPILRCQHEE